MEIRNIAIIAHVDHGKTTLTDALMKQTGMSEEGVTMDSNTLEQERGITIYSKNTSVYYRDTKINIVDTPGHADFGSEVERVLRSIDSVILVVDAGEGPMPQTKFVLKKSLELGLKPIVVINKIDKPTARPDDVQEMVYELFLDLHANDEQLDFTTIYAIARNGIAKEHLNEDSKDLTPLLNTILCKVPIASSFEANNQDLLIQPFNLGYDDFLGRLAIGRIYKGTINQGLNIIIKNTKGDARKGKITKLFLFEGLKRKEVNEAYAGDIIMIAGLPDIFIGQTICINENQKMLPAIKIDFSFIDHYKVYGRGEMHIAILLENMRREGYEVQISQPRVIIKEKNGIKLEPFEEVTILVQEKMSGNIIEKLSKRKGSMLEMKSEDSHIKIIFEIPTRGLLGYRNEFIVDTRGEGILYTHVIGFKPYVGNIEKKDVGSMVSMALGKALGFSLFNLQDRGTLYIGANTEVYEGMVIGNTSKDNDLAVNPTKGKQLTNMRASGSDDAIRLTPPLDITIERGMSIMNDDEYLEITPKNIRLRKKHLKGTDRTKEKRKNQ